LKSLEIPVNLVEYLIINFDKSDKTWKKLLDELRELSLNNRIEVIKIIQEKASKEKKPKKAVSELRKDIKPARFPEIQELAQIILERERQVKCLDNELAYKEVSEEFDQRQECIGSATYVCHHCGRNMCAQHSYWIPDIEFPFIMKKTEVKAEPIPAKAGILCFGLFLIIIGAMLFSMGYYMQTYAIPITIIGVLILLVGIANLLKKKPIVSYPTFVKKMPTKWGKDVQVKYEHKGYYTAVHCWECLKVHHEPIFNYALKILSSVYEESKNWRKILPRKKKLNDTERVNCATYAANRYLNEFKFGKNCYLPLKGINRAMTRPTFENRYKNAVISKEVYNPTPVWIFLLQKRKKGAKKVPKRSVSKWIDKNRIAIKERYEVKVTQTDRTKATGRQKGKK